MGNKNRKEINFNTPKSRELIKKEYETKGLTYTRVIGNMISECKNIPLKDKYDIIELIKGDYQSTHILGYTVAEHLLGYSLSFQDPFTNDAETSKNGKNNTKKNIELLNKRSALNKEAHRVVLLLMYFSKTEVPDLKDPWKLIFDESKGEIDIKLSLVKSINTSIAYYKKDINNINIQEICKMVYNKISSSFKLYSSIKIFRISRKLKSFTST